MATIHYMTTTGCGHEERVFYSTSLFSKPQVMCMWKVIITQDTWICHLLSILSDCSQKSGQSQQQLCWTQLQWRLHMDTPCIHTLQLSALPPPNKKRQKWIQANSSWETGQELPNISGITVESINIWPQQSQQHVQLSACNFLLVCLPETTTTCAAMNLW